MPIPKREQSYTNVNGIQRPVITTKGWDAQVISKQLLGSLTHDQGIKYN